jgi:hypothetical protein
MRCILALWLMLAAPLTVTGQVGLGSAVQPIQLMAVREASVGISLPAGTVATLAGSLTAGLNDFAPLPLATSWNVDPARTASVTLVAYFEVPSRAMASGIAAIPATMIYGRVPGGGAQSFTSFAQGPVMTGTGAIGTAGGTLVLFRQPIDAAHGRGSRTDDVQLRLDLSGSPALPAGSYTGTLNLVAITH